MSSVILAPRPHPEEPSLQEDAPWGTECSCEPSRSRPFLSPIGDWEYIRDIKEKCCYVASDFKKEKMKASSPSYARKFQLPDGQEITLGPEKFLCPEGLFQADLMGEWKEGTRVSPDADRGATGRGTEPSSRRDRCSEYKLETLSEVLGPPRSLTKRVRAPVTSAAPVRGLEASVPSHLTPFC